MMRRSAPAYTRLPWADLLIVVAILAAAAAFKLWVGVPGPGGLLMSPAIAETMDRLMPGEWWPILLPYEYEPGRNYWATTIIPFTFVAERTIGPFQSLLLFSSLFIAVAYAAARLSGAPIIFATSLALMFAFGTQLNYLYTYGNLIALFLLLTYVTVNFAIVFRIAIAPRPSLFTQILFVATLVIVAMASEMWINYATALIAASAFCWIWAWRHRLPRERRASRFILLATLVVLVIYLAVRMQRVGQYLAPGAEEELLITYQYGILFIEDAIANFFTLIYTALSNYLPGFLTSSSSLTYLGPEAILAEQHGYDAAQQQLVVMNHLFLWRFYAGAAVLAFCAIGGKWVLEAWRAPSRRTLFLTVLAIMVIAGVSTHLAIKMRPYNSVPALPYKAIMSITAFSVLAAYLVQIAWQDLKTAWLRWTVVGAVWTSVLLAALTRPQMQARLLELVGLSGYGDPLGRLLQWLQ